MNTATSQALQYFSDPTPDMLILRDLVGACLKKFADPSGIPTHDLLSDALWVWRGGHGVLHARRAADAPDPTAVVASWNSASRRAISFEDLRDAVMMELVE